MVYQTLNSCTHLYTIETSFWVKSASLAPKSNRGLHIRRRLGHVIIWPARLQPTQVPKLVWLGCWFNGQLKNKFSLNNFLGFLLRNDTCVLASNKDVWPSFIAFFCRWMPSFCSMFHGKTRKTGALPLQLDKPSMRIWNWAPKIIGYVIGKMLNIQWAWPRWFT